MFCIPKDFLFDAERHIRDLQELGVNVEMALDIAEVDVLRQDRRLCHQDIPLVSIGPRTLNPTSLLIKRGVDIVGSLFGLLITVILTPFIALAIKLDSPGPIIFGQKRVGQNGRIFTLWKFRSMLQDAESRKKDLLDCNEMTGAIFKIKDDPRITRIGRFLRRTSLTNSPSFGMSSRGK